MEEGDSNGMVYSLIVSPNFNYYHGGPCLQRLENSRIKFVPYTRTCT